MKSKEKAKELVDKMFYSIVDYNSSRNLAMYWDEAKECASHAVDEVIRELEEMEKDRGLGDIPFPYWEKVKQEVLQLTPE